MTLPYEATEERIEPAEPPQMEAAEHVMPMGQNVVPFHRMMTPDEMRREMMRHALQRRAAQLARIANLDNAADLLEPEKLAGIGSKVCREYKLDRDSRKDWEDRAKRAMDMAKQKKEAKTYPWQDASNVKYPLLTTAALQFAARAYPAIVDGQNVVKCKINGADPQGMKASAAERVGQYMSNQLLFEVPGWEDDMDTALHQIPIIGCAFKKVYPDQMSEAGFRSDLISAFDFVVNQRAKSLETVPRMTHVFPLYPHEIGERQRAGWFIDVDLKGSSEDGEDDDAPHMFLEQHRWLDMDEDGTPEPWVVTVHEKTEKVVRIKPCFDPGEIVPDMERGRIIKIPRKEYFVMIPFIPDPEGGFYPVGFGHLLETISDVIDTTINQMMDAGTLQNAGGGFIGGGVDIGKGKAEIGLTPGKYRRVNAPGQDLRQAIVNHEHPGPSKTLFELLGMMVEAGKDVAAVKDILTGDMPKNATATGTMAVIEQGLKVFTAIYKRIYRALGKEYRMIFELNKQLLDPRKYVAFFDVPEQMQQMIAADFQGEMDIVPVSDPNSITDMQRLAKAQFVLEQSAGGQNPVVNHFEATRRAFEAARIEDVDSLLVKPQPGPMDAVMQAGAVADVDLKMAQADKTRAETDKAAADAAVSRASVQLPIGIPIPIAEPQFTPPHLAPMPNMGPLPGMPEIAGNAGMGGPPPDLGPIIDPAQQNPLLGHVPQALAPQGADGEQGASE